MNNVKTVALLAFLSALVWGVAYTWGGSSGFWIGLVLAGGINIVAYFYSDKIALASTRAKPVKESELPEVYSIIRNLASKARMPMPRIYLIDSPQPNAFATGRNPEHAAVAVTTGILQALNRDELEGVLGHELSHVQNRDILISSVAAMLAAALSIFARMAFFFGGGRNRGNPVGAVIGLVAIIVAPIAAILIRMAISRTREYQADESGAELTGRPEMLASALQKIAAGASRRPMNVNPAVSQLFIENPLKAAKGRNMTKYFSTHPPMEDRVRRLMDMASGVR